MYQNKSEDRVITPSHLLLLPLDSTNTLNFLNFKNIGVNTLQESSAFSKIRNFTKIYNSHLVSLPNNFSDKYHKLNLIFGDENSYLTSMTFGLRKQHNLLSTSSLGNSFNSTVLDENSFNTFLSTNTTSKVQLHNSDHIVLPSPLSLPKESVTENTIDSSRLQTLLVSSITNVSTGLNFLGRYPTALSYLNDDSDNSGLGYPAFKVSSPSLLNLILRNTLSTFLQGSNDDLSSGTEDYSSQTLYNVSENLKLFNLVGPNSKILLGDQSVRNFPDLLPNKSNINLSNGFNPITSNLSFESKLNRDSTPYNLAVNTSLGYPDFTLTSNLSSTRSFNSITNPAVHTTTHPNLSSLNYDTNTNTASETFYTHPKGFVSKSTKANSAVSDLFVGSREKTPRSINTAYWSSFWSGTSSTHRIASSLKANTERSSFYLPLFYTYSDYDFRNDQAIDMLEELF
jgi:hypothetical protein